MVYGYYITDTVGNERFFVEGCSYCQMSTGGQHEPACPCKDMKVAELINFLMIMIELLNKAKK